MKRFARRGSATVEFSIVIPLVFLFVLGLMEWGRFEMIRHVTSTAAFNGCRLATLQGVTEPEVETRVNEILDVYFVSQATTTTTFEEEDVTVHVEVPVAPNSFFLVRFFGNVTLEREFTLALE